MDTQLTTDVWPHAAALKELRKRNGNLSVERAAGRIGASRATWNAWETGKQRPSYENLHAIVETFQCPPELVGYEAPEGFELVPTVWLQQEAEQARQRHDELLVALRRIGIKAGVDISK